MFLPFSLALLPLVVAAQGSTYTPLNITALSSRDGYSVTECWQLETVPVAAMAAMNYEVGKSVKATWSIIPPRTTVGEAWAPTVQLSVILNGLIRITSPAPAPVGSMSSPAAAAAAASGPPEQSVAYVMPGTLASSVVIAADLKSMSTLRGHFTEFPSDEPTVLVQVPFENNEEPPHSVLHDGPCWSPPA